MALNFPNSPEVDQEYSFGSRTWRWDGSKWNLIGSGINDLVSSETINSIVKITQAEYDALDPPDETTLYLIT